MKTETKNPPRNEWGPFPFGDGARILDIRYDAVFKNDERSEVAAVLART